MKKCLGLMLLALMVSVCLGLTYTYDTTTPPDDQAIGLGATRIREVKNAVQERLNVDHVFAKTGSEVSHADSGKQFQVTFTDVDTSLVADGGSDDTHSVIADGEGILDIIDVDSTRELHFWDEASNIIQLTDGGQLNLTGTYANTVSLTVDTLTGVSDGTWTLPIDTTTDTTEGNIRYDNTDDTVSYRSASAWLTILNTTDSAAKMKIGTYTGDDGATKAIIGMGFQPEVLMVIPGVESLYVSIKTTDMGTKSKIFNNSHKFEDNVIVSLDADGFTVGSTSASADGNMNKLDKIYYYIAMKVLD